MMDNHLFSGTGSLSRFILRRDRIRIPIWIFSFVFATVAIGAAFTGLYENAQERQAIAATMENPAMTAMVGPGFGLDNYTAGAMMAHQMLLMTAVVVGLMSVLLVIRHTRTDEEEGRIEMVRSLPVGRLSNVTATLMVLFLVNIVLATVTGIGLYALNIESMDLEGSLLYGAALGATGMVFASITAVFAQLSHNARSAVGMSIAFLLLAYLVRAVGDVGNEALSWLSPLGWIVRSEVYVNNIWWPILLTVGAAMVFGVLAMYLNSIRDLGAGFLPARAGRIHASPFLQGPLGLAFRLQRTGFIAWAIGMYVLGASYGSVMGDMESFFADVDLMQDLLVPVEGFSLVEQFIPTLMAVMGIIATIPVLLAILKLKGEEKNDRTEHILGRAVSRNRLLGSYLFISVISSWIMVSLAGLGLGTIADATMEEGFDVAMALQAALAYLPAVWVMIGLSVLLIGWLPKFTGFIWLYLTFSFFVIYLGSLFQLPEWVAKVTPFGYVSAIPLEEFDWLQAALLTAVAIALMAVGFVGYNKRDIGK